MPRTSPKSLRSIPARAGEPPHHAHGHCQPGVYPRACGGTRPQSGERLLPWGLSPRVRGNLPKEAAIAREDGSIPARAGEPVARSPGIRSRWVYPRACGGTADYPARADRQLGLSPRVRGNPAAAGGGPDQYRSIPARAGEPSASARTLSTCSVYPRACGGTDRLPDVNRPLGGLSPRVRGNPEDDEEDEDGDRSIPARAGEPLDSD